MGDQSIVELCLDKTHTKEKYIYDCFIFYMTELQKLHIACVYELDNGSSCMGLPARDTIIAHKLFLRISIGCVNKVHPPLVCSVCESGGRGGGGCPRDSVIQVVLCIIIVPDLMNKEPPPPPPPPPSS